MQLNSVESEENEAFGNWTLFLGDEKMVELSKVLSKCRINKMSIISFIRT